MRRDSITRTLDTAKMQAFSLFNISDFRQIFWSLFESGFAFHSTLFLVFGL